MSTTQPRNKIAAGGAPLLSGVAFAILTVIAFVVLGHASSSPKIGSPTGKIVSFYLAHHGSEELAAYLLAVNAVLLAVFVTACRSRVSAAGSAWTNLFFAGGMAIMLLGAAATLSRRSDRLRILGWIAVPLAIINLTPAGVGAFPVTALWIIATGVLISRDPDRAVRSAVAPALAT